MTSLAASRGPLTGLPSVVISEVEADYTTGKLVLLFSNHGVGFLRPLLRY